MAGLVRTRAAKRTKGEPYASIPLRLLATPTLRRLNDEALATFLLLNANWVPGSIRSEPGKAILPQRTAAKYGRCRTRGATDAFKELAACGMIVLHRLPVLPGAMGGAKPRAAEWRIPSREVGSRLPTLGHNQRSPEGSLRIHNQRLRQVVRELAGTPLRLMMQVLTLHDRTGHDGKLVSEAPFPLATSFAEELLNRDRDPGTQFLSRACAGRAVQRLFETKALILAAPGTGRRCATVTFGDAFRRREKHLLESQKAVCPSETLQP